ncbi:glycosyltransferase family 2 protein [Polaribacter sp.]|uniref:glycosyltransferase family 2 protein n=1 Tax=Polaribacter sp. TaxID=1920175 RepID=UPI003F6B6CAB
MIWFLVSIGILYAILIIAIAIGFKNIKSFQNENRICKNTFSVIIPFRNEAENLPRLLASIHQINYPKNLVEFIFVDDASTDDSVAVIEKNLDTISQKSEITRTDIKIINNKRKSNAPKKDAITTAISLAKYNWIVTTDADCMAPKNWLNTLDNFIQLKKPKMIVAPVNYMAQNNSIEQFQLLDFMSLQGTTIGSFGLKFPFLCNGANLAYKKDEFLNLNGFDGNNNIASGDDIFIFEKFLKSDKNAVQFLKSKDATVHTFPVKNWQDLINQRVRWAAKTSNLNLIAAKLIGAFIFLVNLSIIFCVLFVSNIYIILATLVAKLLIDLVLFIPTLRFYEHKKTLYRWYLFSAIFYPFFSVFIVLKSFFTNYHWKGRVFKK